MGASAFESLSSFFLENVKIIQIRWYLEGEDMLNESLIVLRQVLCTLHWLTDWGSADPGDTSLFLFWFFKCKWNDLILMLLDQIGWINCGHLWPQTRIYSGCHDQLYRWSYEDKSETRPCPMLFYFQSLPIKVCLNPVPLPETCPRPEFYYLLVSM